MVAKARQAFHAAVVGGELELVRQMLEWSATDGTLTRVTSTIISMYVPVHLSRCNIRAQLKGRFGMI